MISSRYAVTTIIFLLIALIPTLLHSYIGATFNDGRSVHAISTTLSHFNSSPARRNKHWGKDTFGSDDWFERIYLSDQTGGVRLFAARSYDQKRLYHHPELALSYGKNLPEKSITTLPGHPEISVHLLNTSDNSTQVAYVLIYDESFIKSPLKHQLSESLRLLVTARKPMTLFYASETRPSPDTHFSQSASATVLSLAIKSFQAQNNTI